MANVNNLDDELISDICDDTIEHHGVKGMKWGIRKDKETSSNNKVFISGSSKTTDPNSGYYRKELPKQIIDKIDSYVKNQNEIIVGDAPGIDSQVQDYLNKSKYNNVTIYTTSKSPRYLANKDWKYKTIDTGDLDPNSKEGLRLKDEAMSKDAGHGLAVILENGGASATRNNVQRLLDQKKDVNVFMLKSDNNDSEVIDIPAELEKKEVKHSSDDENLMCDLYDDNIEHANYWQKRSSKGGGFTFKNDPDGYDTRYESDPDKGNEPDNKSSKDKDKSSKKEGNEDAKSVYNEINRIWNIPREKRTEAEVKKFNSLYKALKEMDNAEDYLDPEEEEPPMAIESFVNGAAALGRVAGQLPVKKGKTVYKKYHKLSDEELAKRIKRLELEQKYSNLRGDTKYVRSGSEKLRDTLQNVGAIASIASMTLIPIIKAKAKNN